VRCRCRAESRTLADVPETPDERRIPRQRWRIRYERDKSAAGLTQREEADAWTDTIGRSGLPVLTAGEPPRPRIALGPPLPTGCLALDEPLELFLHERWTIRDVRTALATVAPAGHRITLLHDVWPGAAALQAAGRAVDYAIRTEAVPIEELSEAAAVLLGATELQRERVRGTRTVIYDLRPLIETIVVEAVAGDDPARCLVRFRARLDPDHGVARPDELLAALGERLSTPIVGIEIVRTRVWLSDDPLPPPL
jgi:radical SAM-linked protein